MHAAHAKSLDEFRTVRVVFARLDLGERGYKIPIAPVEVLAHDVLLPFKAQATCALTRGADPVVRDKFAGNHVV